jgi:hypothetical protein
MAPTLRQDDIVVMSRRKPRAGQIAIAHKDGLEIIKRVTEVKGSRFYLTGDNAEESTDSRHYGYITKKDILGTIMIVLPRAIDPPKAKKTYGVLLGRLTALILVMTLAHLYRIDTFIPLLDDALPSGPAFATASALIIILTELFAIPFALRMKLSPLANLVSGALIVFAPLWWVAVDVLTVGLMVNSAQLGQFLAVPSTYFTMLLNLLWLGLSYLTLYSLGYNNLSLRPRLRS